MVKYSFHSSEKYYRFHITYHLPHYSCSCQTVLYVQIYVSVGMLTERHMYMEWCGKLRYMLVAFPHVPDVVLCVCVLLSICLSVGVNLQTGGSAASGLT